MAVNHVKSVNLSTIVMDLAFVVQCASRCISSIPWGTFHYSPTAPWLKVISNWQISRHRTSSISHFHCCARSPTTCLSTVSPVCHRCRSYFQIFPSSVARLWHTTMHWSSSKCRTCSMLDWLHWRKWARVASGKLINNSGNAGPPSRSHVCFACLDFGLGPLLGPLIIRALKEIWWE